jgi:phage protein D
MAQVLCSVSGIRAGIDGDYRISEATHSLARENGWTTTLFICETRRDSSQ